MSTTTTKQVALIVGGASGIGEATARKLASRGCFVVVADVNEKLGKSVAEDISKTYGVEAEFVKIDVTNEESVKTAVGFAASRTGRLDFAANCAGICESTWEEEKSISVEVFDQTHAVNTRGIWLCQKYEARQMQKQEPRQITFDPPPSRHTVPGQRGSIANVASISGLHAMGLAAYTPSKYAAVGVTKNGAKFYGPDGIRCNVLCPGWTMTAMTEHSMGEEAKMGTRENEDSSVAKSISLRRMAFAQEQANVLGFLLSDESSYMNGSVVVVDGGYHDIR